MRPLRAVGDWLAGRPSLDVHPLDDEPPAARPDWAERERLMRHTGQRECPIPEHGDALRRLGRMTIERNEALAMADLWMRRALAAEARTRHPSAGTEAA